LRQGWVIDESQQMVFEQRSVGGKALARCQLGFERRGKKIPGQIDAGPLPGHILVEIVVEALVTKVDFRRQADEKRVDVKGGELKEARQFVKAEDNPPLGAFGLALSDIGVHPVKHRPDLRRQ